jgi:hypothetical protein
MSRLAFALALLTCASTSYADRIAPAEMRIAPAALDRAALRAKLAENRSANLAAFRAYRIAGVYPSNVHASSLANVWRDDDGHYCAAATIIRTSGNVALVERVAEENNAFRIVDVAQGPVMDWILTSGLTQAELVLIQRPFRPVAQDLDKPAVDPALRAAETRRLAKLYKSIERKLANQRGASLEAAVERLMKRPDLARALLSS